MLQKAIQKYNAATHLLEITLPLTKDPKILIGIIHNIFKSIQILIDLLLEQNNIKVTSSQAKIAFLSQILKDNNQPKDTLKNIEEMKEILELHEKCPTEFSRKDKFYLANKDFRIKPVTISDTKKYLKINQNLISLIKNRKE
jgi:hypothetical protein